MGAAQPRGLIVVLMISVGVFFSAMILLVWWLEYRDRMDVIERAALQATVVCVTREAVFIETVGPFGKASETIAHPFKLFARRMPGVRAECLHFVPRKGKTVHLFPGLSHGELCWIAAEIRTAMNAA